MKILICGCRDYQDYEKIRKYVEEKKEKNDELIVVQGGASGADALAKRACGELGIECREYKANWKKYGRAAGPKRNQQMLDEEHPDLVVAFHPDIEGSKGTKDMINRAKRLGYETEVVGEKKEVFYPITEEKLTGEVDEESVYKIGSRQES